MQNVITVAERQVASWQQQMEDTIIRAPFAGIATSKNAQPGEMISPISAGGGFSFPLTLPRFSASEHRQGSGPCHR